MIDGKHMDVASPAFVRQFGTTLRAHRRARRVPLRWLAARSGRRFSARDLADAEAGALVLDPDSIAELTTLYGVDPEAVLPANRRGVTIREGLISAGGVTVPFEPGHAGSLVTAYFRLARTLRAVDDDVPVPLRRDDVAAIAGYVNEEIMRGAIADDHLTQSLRLVVAMAEGDRRVRIAALRSAAESIGLVDEDDRPVPVHGADGATGPGRR